MTRITIRTILLSVAILAAAAMNGLSMTGPTNAEEMDSYQNRIGIDMTVDDFRTTVIDKGTMGQHLAGMVDFLLENYMDGTYSRMFHHAVRECAEPLNNKYFHVRKIKFVEATKNDSVIDLVFTIQLDSEQTKLKKTDVTFRFIDGVSESKMTNELFSMMSRYVQMREAKKRF